jgi:hypothetical protein
MQAGSGYPLQVLARSSLRAFRFYPSREMLASPWIDLSYMRFGSVQRFMPFP